MSDHHDCPRLVMCANHPKPRILKIVWKNRWGWGALRPGNRVAGHFPTHAEAINYAQKEATK